MSALTPELSAIAWLNTCASGVKMAGEGVMDHAEETETEVTEILLNRLKPKPVIFPWVGIRITREELLRKLLLHQIIRGPCVKKLSLSDIRCDEDRLVINKAFLECIPKKNRNASHKIPVTVYAKIGEAVYEYSLLLKQEKNDGRIVLRHSEEENSAHWRDIIRELGLRKDDSIKFWIYGDSQTDKPFFLMERK